MSESKRITTLGALMSAMWTRDISSRKTLAEIFELHPDYCKVWEHFDDGKGHSNAFTTRISELDRDVLNDAKSRGYVTGKVMPGHISSTDFVLTKDKHLLDEIWKLVASWRDEEHYKKRSEEDVRNGLPGTYIKIVAIPDGEAPDWVRQAWVGLILPSSPLVGYSKWEDREKGVLLGEKNNRNRYCYIVLQEEAIKILSEKNKDAASWWTSNGFPKDGEECCFSFHDLEVSEVAGTFFHQKVQVHDSETGELEH